MGGAVSIMNIDRWGPPPGAGPLASSKLWALSISDIRDSSPQVDIAGGGPAGTTFSREPSRWCQDALQSVEGGRQGGQSREREVEAQP